MDIDSQIAAALGFPRTHYMNVERERRWLCSDFPRDQILRSDRITDLYVEGTRLRLRESRSLSGGPDLLRLTRKADADAFTRLLTSIYLPEDEFALLKQSLRGSFLVKIRHRLQVSARTTLAIDEFEGPLAGLLLVEAEFDSDEALHLFAPPEFVTREVTNEPGYCGWHLARFGLPQI